MIQQMQQQVQQQQQLVIGTRFKELGFNVNSGRINGIHQTRDMLVAQLYLPRRLAGAHRRDAGCAGKVLAGGH